MSSKQVLWKQSYNRIFNTELDNLKKIKDNPTLKLSYDEHYDINKISNNLKILIKKIFTDINILTLSSSIENYNKLLDMMESINDKPFINDELFDSDIKNILIQAGLIYRYNS